jgi:hypothetical protein
MVKATAVLILIGVIKVSKNNARLVRNCLETPDGTILYSRHRHDYQHHIDENGKTYFTDGGLDYVRCSANGDEIHHHVWNDEPFDKVREAVEWGTYGKDGNNPLSWKRLCDMTSEHIEAILENVPSISSLHRDIFNLELKHRESEDATHFIFSNN